MINIFKFGPYLGEKETEVLFSFRDIHIRFLCKDDKDARNIIKTSMNREQLEALLKWGQECLNDKRCDLCWSIKLPKNIECEGRIKCYSCGGEIK